MAVLDPVDIGSIATFDAGGTTAVLTFTGTADVGHKVLVVCGNNVASGTITSAVDTRGNTWVIDRTQTSTNVASAFLLRTDIQTAIQVGDTLTITFGQSTTNRLACAARCVGLAAGGPETSIGGASAGIVTSASWVTSSVMFAVSAEAIFIGGVLDNDTTLVTSTPTAGTQVELFDFGTSDGVSIAVNYRHPVTVINASMGGTFSVVQSKQWSVVAAVYGAALIPVRPFNPIPFMSPGRL